MSKCCSWLNHLRCCRRQSEQTYIYLYSPDMASSSTSSSALLRCLACILFGFCLVVIFILTAIVIYHLNSNHSLMWSKPDIPKRTSSMARMQHLPDFVDLDIDPCENFYDFVCDKGSQYRKSDQEELQEEYEEKWTRIRHRIHDKLMMKLNLSQLRSSEDNASSSQSSISTLYQLCETQESSVLLDELDQHFINFIQQEPYRSYLTLFNRTDSINMTDESVVFQYNPFFHIIPSSSSSHNNSESYSTIIRTSHRPLPSPAIVFPMTEHFNQTAWINLIEFNNDYTKLLLEGDDLIKFYEQEYNQDAMIVKRIQSSTDYHRCLSSLHTRDGLKNLIQLLNHFLQHRLRQFNTKLIDKQIRILETIVDNHTLVEHLKRIRLEFKIIEQIVPLEHPSVDNNSSCVLHLLDKLLDKRITRSELPPNAHIYFHDMTSEYFSSNDWPYLIMLYDRLLKNRSIDSIVNFVYFDYYRRLVYPYYQPHLLHYFTDLNSNYQSQSYRYIGGLKHPDLSCYVGDCYDVLNCYHPSFINALIDNKNEISVDSIKINIENLLARFRLLVEQSDNLFIEEKKLLIHKLMQIRLVFGHHTTPDIIHLPINSSSYLDYVQYLSSIPYDQEQRSYAIEPTYNPDDQTLFLPYGFLYVSNNSIEYTIMKFILKILSETIHSNPFYIECLIKSSDELNTTAINVNDEHIIYLLSRSKFLSEQSIILDEYLWPFMSANLIMKHFLIDYTVNNYCHNYNSYHLFLNNSYLLDDIYLVFHCKQASSIKQSKCSVN